MQKRITNKAIKKTVTRKKYSLATLTQKAYQICNKAGEHEGRNIDGYRAEYAQARYD